MVRSIGIFLLVTGLVVMVGACCVYRNFLAAVQVQADPCREPHMSNLPIASIDNLDKTVRSYKSLARMCGNELRFIDGASGSTKEKMRVTPRGEVFRTLLVDLDNDTLAVTLYLSRQGQRRAQVHSRMTRKQVADFAVELSGQTSGIGDWTGAEVVGTDPGGFVVLNHRTASGDNAVHILAAKPGMKTSSLPATHALAVGSGVVLSQTSPAELAAHEVATGRQLWRTSYRNRSAGSAPWCAVAWRERFILSGHNYPIAVEAKTGRAFGAGSAIGCLHVDPIGNVAVDGPDKKTASGINLTTGARLWSKTSSQTFGSKSEIVSVFDNLVYLTTPDGPRHLDARTGAVTPGHWNLAPVEQHDRWVVVVTSYKRREAVLSNTNLAKLVSSQTR